MSIVGVVVVALFCALFARLWYLQVAGGTKLAAVATANRVRIVPLSAPRGEILDAKGRVLVDNRVANVVTVDRRLDLKTRKEVVARLSPILGVDVATINRRIDDVRVSPYKPVPVALDVPIDTLSYIAEHNAEFPGVNAEAQAVRRYRYGSLSSQTLGYVGEVTQGDLKGKSANTYALGDEIGKAGVEESYDNVLRGTPGAQRLEIDVRGRVIRTLSTTPPKPGRNVQLAVDLDAQKVAEDSLAQGIAAARGTKDPAIKDHFQKFAAPAGTVVVLDATDGSVVAMASNPSYDPNEFASGIPTAQYQALNDPANHYPLLNRAIQGQYAPGSTFKLVTALAGLSSGDITPNTTIDDNACIDLKVAGGKFCNDNNASYGPVSLRRAITVSSDVYFYTIGRNLWTLFRKGDPAGEAIQAEARSLGLGKPTGIALPGEAAGRVPDAAWKKAFNASNPDPKSKAANSVWLPGDNIHLAVGQGDLLLTPLQLASAYATFANGGTVHTPRVVDAVIDPTDQKAQPLAPATSGTVPIDPTSRSTMMAGFQGVVADSTGTAAGAFSGFPFNLVTVAGKTGTAQVAGKSATSVFVAMTPVEQPRYVVLAMVEEGGYGAQTAAPIVRRVIEGLNGLPLSNISSTAPSTGAN